ncbi:PREDICTED: MOB kinase activator 1B [Chrysochloris asiatica]|uniref:MOB kinase activator 1B n=1 Tax=Chrysochloris asiatica TaxID=185453 RepID=A0A9B0X0B1_CHRAS|nr:PREDICTED: MOB kinase activator 1B [Chrysochloris asiatica]
MELKPTFSLTIETQQSRSAMTLNLWDREAWVHTKRGAGYKGDQKPPSSQPRGLVTVEPAASSRHELLIVSSRASARALFERDLSRSRSDGPGGCGRWPHSALPAQKIKCHRFPVTPGHLGLDRRSGDTMVNVLTCEVKDNYQIRHGGSRSSKTFKPKKNIPEGSHQYELLKHAEATLGSGNLRMAVMLPEGEDLNEWVAVNTVDFFNQINMLYGTITDFCTEESCPVMSAGPKYEYHWADGTNIKKPIKCSAPKYIDYLMTWVQDQLDDETLFPSKIGVPFPKNFMSVAKTILKRLFRVYAHIYHQHFDPVIQLQEEAHLNTSFKHFIFFVQEFNLIDRRELAPLQELIEKLTSKDR